MMILMNISINMVNEARNYGARDPVLKINNYNCRGFKFSMKDI